MGDGNPWHLDLGPIRTAQMREAPDLKKRFFEHPEEFITIKETADILRLSSSRVRELVQEGKIRAIRVSGTLWIWRPSLDDLVREY